jgi:hypothetical protein
VNPIVGSTVTLQASYLDADSVPYDPDSVDLEVIDPLGVLSTPTPVNVEVGVYEHLLLLDQAGLWAFRFTGTTDQTVAVAEDTVCASDSIFAQASA